MRSRFWIGLAVCILLGCIQAATRLHFSLYVDEPWTANLVHLPYSEMWKVFHEDSAQVPLYYLLLKPVVGLMGEGEASLRCLSMLFFAGMLILTGLAARSLGGNTAGLLAAFLISISLDLGLVLAAWARPYSLLGLLTSLNLFITLSMLQFSHKNSSRFWFNDRQELVFFVLNLIISLAGLFTHNVFIFFIIASILSLWLVSIRKFFLYTTSNIISVAIFLALWGKNIIFGIQNPSVDWISRPGVGEFLEGYSSLWGGFQGCLILIYLVVMIRRSKISFFQIFESGQLQVLLSLVLLTILIPVIVSQFKPVYIPTRLPIITLPAASVLAAVLISKFSRTRTILIFCSVLAVISVSSSLKNLKYTVPTEISLEYVIDRSHCGDRLVSIGLSHDEVEYYLRHLKAPDCLRHITFPGEMEDHPGWFDQQSLQVNLNAYVNDADLIAREKFPNSDSKVWLFYYAYPPYEQLASILKKELDNHITYVLTAETSGSFFTSIHQYRPKLLPENGNPN